MSIIEGVVVEGKVQRVMSGKGYCFVDVEDQGDVFCHISGFSNRSNFDLLREGDLVELELEDTEKGIQGNNVVKK